MYKIRKISIDILKEIAKGIVSTMINEENSKLAQRLTDDMNKIGIKGKITINCEIEDVDFEILGNLVQASETVIVETKVPTEQEEKADEYVSSGNWYKEKNDDD